MPRHIFPAKEHFEELCALGLGEFLRNQPRRRIRERGAEAADLLELDGVVDFDGEPRNARGTELERLFQKRFVQVLRGFDHVDANGDSTLECRQQQQQRRTAQNHSREFC